MSKCTCAGCNTQNYYDQVRKGKCGQNCRCGKKSNPAQYELVVRTPEDSEGHGLELSTRVDAVDAANIFTEYFGLESTLTFTLEQED